MNPRTEFVFFTPETPIKSREPVTVSAVVKENSLKPYGIVIPAFVGQHFDVLDVRIRGQSAFVGTGPLPAIVFSEKVVGVITEDVTLPLFRGQILQPEERVEMTIINKSEEPRKLGAVLLGQVFSEKEIAEMKETKDIVPISNRWNPSEKPPSPLQTWKENYIKSIEHSFDAGVHAADLTRQSRQNIGERRYVLGFDSTTVPANTCVNITKRPQIRFQPSDLIIPDEIAKNFKIVDIKVGKNSQFSASGEIAASNFSDRAPERPRLLTDICEVSMDVVLCLRNKTDKEAEFQATIIGDGAI